MYFAYGPCGFRSTPQFAFRNLFFSYRPPFWKFSADNRCILVPRLRFPGWEFLSGYQFEFWIIISEQWAVIELFHLWISCEFPRYQNDTKRKTFHRFVFYLWRTVSKTKQKCALGFLSSKLVQNMPTTFPVCNKFVTLYCQRNEDKFPHPASPRRSNGTPRNE